MIRTRNLLFLCLLTPIVLRAESKNPADYPLRVHILGKNQTTFYHNRFAEEAKGEGRANIFENGEARGADFTFDCSENLRHPSASRPIPPNGRSPIRS